VLLPGPSDVVASLWVHRQRLLLATWTTLQASVGGLAIAMAFAGLGAILFQRSRWLEVALYPYALLIQTVPIVAIAPLLVVWLGYGRPVATVTAAIVAFFPLLTSANLGLRSAEPAQVALLRLYGASWRQTLMKLRLPAALPFAFSGLRTAVGLAVIGAVVGEFVGSTGHPPCLGYLVIQSSRSADTGLTFATIGITALLALMLFALVRWAEIRMIGPWHGEDPA
jgi:NitT/TauT family transport system permease protein